MPKLSFSALAGLRVALINMPLRESAKPNTPPQGPGLLAALLRRHGADVSLIDLNGYRLQDERAQERGLTNGRHLLPQEAEELIGRYFNRDGQPHIIGLSGMITTLVWQTRIATICKKLAPEATLISGGGLATELNDIIFGWIPELDILVLGEGEEAILRIADQTKKSLDRRKGHRPVEKQVITGTRPEIDELPFPAWDMIEQDVDGYPLLEGYIRTPVWGGIETGNSSATNFTMERSLTTVSSRGCPFNCEFCYRGTQGERQYGCRSARNLIEEAAWLKEQYDLDFVGFPDDNFGINQARLEVLAERFLQEVGLRWGTHARLDVGGEQLSLMAKAGCVYLGFGAESASKRVLANMNKGGEILSRGETTINGFRFPQAMVESLLRAKEVGIHSNCTWIMGYPGEKLDDLKTSVAFILWQIEKAVEGLAPWNEEYAAAYDSVNQKMFVATAYPGTAMFRRAKVQKVLAERFGLRFAGKNVVPDDNFRRYVEALEDASKVITGPDGRIVNYSDMDDDQFTQARSLIEAGQLFRVLNL